ncbi:Peptidase family S41 [Chitinophaga jiangningensis]|uniref:Peptidase family S41 n=1 Tax=Chitinophaga jiangningensis TaxID=1419482 RepID=A0A1M6VRG9_9BACT|nr:S41 family peptidase [Chitinophaga jiangningensis]SHK83931.1 Peptidase family S41 [Chitinophaga jiangningensis]
MKIKLSIFILLMTAGSAYAQAPACDCAAEFKYIRQKVETNYSGFNDKVKQYGRKSYDSLVSSLQQLAPEAVRPTYCLFLVKQYIDFFHDGHLILDRPADDSRHALPEIARARAARKEVESVPLSAWTITRLKTSTGPEGIFWNEEGTVRMAVTESKNKFRDYVAQVLVSYDNKWRKGDILMELKYDTVNYVFNGFEYTDMGLLKNISLVTNSNSFGKWIRESAGFKPGNLQAATTTPATFVKKLSDKTYYLRMASFEQDQLDAIDSVMKANNKDIAAHPNLIIDVRGNGGGSDAAFAAVSPLLYTDSIRITGADVWATEDNINSWKELLKVGLPEDTKAALQKVVDTMAANKGKMVPISRDTWKKVTATNPAPKKVVVLMDGGCASTTEEFLLQAKQSKKTTLMGAPSAGIADYANVRVARFKTLPFVVGYPTSRNRRIDKGQGVDNAGVKPAVIIKDTDDWVAYAQAYLEK